MEHLQLFPGLQLVTRRRTLKCLGALAGALLLGCQEETVSRYSVPKPEKFEEEPPPEEKPRVRLLVAVFSQGDFTWFFKLVGPVAQVGEHEKAFDEFVRSLRFSNQPNQPVAWKLPAGWREEPGNAIRFATFKLGPKDAPLELTVFRFPGKGGSTLDNVNRWRKLDLGLKPVNDAQMAKVTRELKAEGAAGTLVDMSGPGTGKF
jgi:hypothetical protein